MMWDWAHSGRSGRTREPVAEKSKLTKTEAVSDLEGRLKRKKKDISLESASRVQVAASPGLLDHFKEYQSELDVKRGHMLED